MATEQQQAAGSSKPKMPILIGLVAVGLAVGAGTGAAFIGPMVARKMGKSPEVVAQARAASADADAEYGNDTSSEHESYEAAASSGKSPAAPVHLLENLVLNPAGSGGSRFLLLSVAMEIDSPKAAEDLKSRDAELRDIILTTLGTKTVDELTDITLRDQFKKELQVAVTTRFGKNAVKRLYFPQFVVQ